jgi:hypothetical protein
MLLKRSASQARGGDVADRRRASGAALKFAFLGSIAGSPPFTRSGLTPLGETEHKIPVETPMGTLKSELRRRGLPNHADTGVYGNTDGQQHAKYSGRKRLVQL